MDIDVDEPNEDEIQIREESNRPNRGVSPILERISRRSRIRTHVNIQDSSIISGHFADESELNTVSQENNLHDVPQVVIDHLRADHASNEHDTTNSTNTVNLINENEPEVSNIDENSASSFIEKDIDTKSNEDLRCKKRALSETEDEEGLLCPICLDYWTNSGDHRLTALKCGHLFGHACIKRWLRGDIKNRYCPTCKMKAHIKDLRFIFAKKIIVSDTTEQEHLREQLNKVTAEKSKLELEYQVCLLNLQLQSKQILELKESNYMLQLNQSASSSNAKTSSIKSIDIYLEKNLVLSTEPGCRVLSYNPYYQLLAVSQKSQGNIFPGYGVKLIDMKNFKPLQFVYSGHKPIRHIQFNMINVDLLLIVSLDKSAKVYDLQKKSIILNVTTDIPLWSCCWDALNPNIFYIGGQQGVVMQYEMSNPQTCMESFKVGDMSPVVSLCALKGSGGSALPHGGILVCKLNSCWVIETHGTSYTIHPLPFEGPFVSLSFETTSQHLLISARPSQRYAKIRHTVAVLEKVENVVTAHAVHIFQGGQQQKMMSRSNQIKFYNENLVAAFDEEYKGIIIWNVRSGQKIKTLPCTNAVMDVCSVEVDSNTYLASLSETTLRIYNIKYS